MGNDILIFVHEPETYCRDQMLDLDCERPRRWTLVNRVKVSEQKE